MSEPQVCKKCRGARVVGKKRAPCPRCKGTGTWAPPAEEIADLDEADRQGEAIAKGRRS